MKRVLFLVGPTGSGKTEVSLCLARRLGGEIVSADSMLVYRGMDIGTAKPTRRERQSVSHHLIDIVSPQKDFSVYAHRKQALKAVQEIIKRNRLPVVIGGGGLYVEALLKGLSAHPGGNSKVRSRLSKEAKRRPTSFLYQRLQAVDPTRAQRIHPNDRQRIVRALEIAEVSGKPPSEWYRERRSLGDLGFSVRVFGIQRERSELYERINRRVEAMFRKGFLDEVKRLQRKGFSRTAKQALGYREILESLGRDGRGGRSQLVGLIQRRTRQFAKRQLTWLRREKEIEWIPWRRGETPSTICDKIAKETEEWLGKKHCS